MQQCRHSPPPAPAAPFLLQSIARVCLPWQELERRGRQIQGRGLGESFGQRSVGGHWGGSRSITGSVSSQVSSASFMAKNSGLAPSLTPTSEKKRVDSNHVSPAMGGGLTKVNRLKRGGQTRSFGAPGTLAGNDSGGDQTIDQTIVISPDIQGRQLQTVKQSVRAAAGLAHSNPAPGAEKLPMQLLAMLTTPVVVITSEMKVLLWNAGFAGALGYSVREGKDRYFAEFMSPECRPVLQTLLRSFTQRGKAKGGAAGVLSPSGSDKGCVNVEVTFVTKVGGAVDANLTVVEMQLDDVGDGGGSAGGKQPGGTGLLAMLSVLPPDVGNGKFRRLSPAMEELLSWKPRKGNFGVVSPMRRMRDNMIVAAKKINLTTGALATRQAHENEATVLKSFSHTNIVAFVDTFKADGFLYILMECASGGDLRHRVDSQARLEPRQYFPEHLISYWAAQLAAALNYLHERSWVHRDIKSANVFLTLTEEVKLGDFGHAKHIAGETERSVAGTPESMSPEVILGKEYGAKTDVWSLGVVLYEAAMLHRPFDGNTIRELLGAIVSGNYAPIVRKDCKDYRYLVNQLLTVDVQHRPTMQEVFSFPTIQQQLRMAAEVRRRFWRCRSTLLRWCHSLARSLTTAIRVCPPPRPSAPSVSTARRARRCRRGPRSAPSWRSPRRSRSLASLCA